MKKANTVPGMWQSPDSDLLLIQARRCIRCGRLLTSAKAVKDGIGCACARQLRRQAEIPGQMSIEDYL